MVGLIVGLGRGLWNRVVGLLASGSASPGRLQEIALTLPTSISITEDESITLLGMADRAITAGQKWWNDMDFDESDIPVVPWTQFPSIDGGEPGEYNFGVLIGPSNEKVSGEPVFWSDRKITDVQKVIANLYEYVSDHKGADTVTFYNELIQALEENRRDAVIPMWLYRYISPDNWNG